MFDVFYRQRIILFIGIQSPPVFFPQQGAIHAKILANAILIAPFIKLNTCKVSPQTIQAPGTFFPVVFEDPFFLISGLSPYLIIMVYPAALFSVLFIHTIQGISLRTDNIVLPLGISTQTG